MRPLTGHYYGKVGGGLFGYATRPSETQDELVLVRLSDGREGRFSLPARWRIGDVLYVTADEALLRVSRGSESTLFRIALRDLSFEG